MDKKSEVYNFYLRTKGGWGVVSGKSMEPTLKEGWKIKVEPSDEDKIKIVDIALFCQDILTCHRIMGKVKFFGQAYFIHKGDNSIIGGIFGAKDLMGKITEVFDEKGQRLKIEKWKHNSFRNIKIFSYVYLFMYLVKRCICGKKTNRLTSFINRNFWRFLLEII
jgi:hypothetical protein